MRMKMISCIATFAILLAVVLMYSQLYQPLNAMLKDMLGFAAVVYGRDLLASLLVSIPLLLFLWTSYANLAHNPNADDAFVLLNISQSPPMFENNGEIPRFGGVLILLTVCMVTAVVMAIFNLVDSLLQLSDSLFATKTAVLMAEIIFNMLVVGLVLYLTIIFFSKRRTLPSLLSAFIGFQVLVCLIFVLILTSDINTRLMADKWLHALMLNCFTAFIWIPYLLTSERVKRTFITSANAEA